MAHVAQILGGMRTTDFIQGMIGLVAIMGLLTTFVFVMGKVSNGVDFGSSSAMLLSLSVFIWIFGEVLKQVKNIDPGTMISFAGSLALALTALVGACIAVNKLGGGIGGMAKGALGISAAIGIVVVAVTGIVFALGEIDDLSKGDFKRKLENGAAIIGTIGGAIDQLSTSLKITIGAIVVASEVLAAVLPKDGVKTALKGTVIAGLITSAIDLVVIVIGALVAGIGALDGCMKGNLSADIERGGEVLSVLSTALKPFNSGMGAAVVAIVGLSEVMGTIPGGIFAAAKGVVISTLITAAIGLVVTLIGALVEGIGALDEATEGAVLDNVARGGEVLEQVGVAIGKFIGGIQEGTITAVANGLEKFSKANIDEEKVNKCTACAEQIMNLHNGLKDLKIGTAVANLINGRSAFSEFIASIPAFASSMVEAGTSLSGLDKNIVSNIDTAISAAGKFKELYEKFDESKGIFGSLDDVIGNWINGGSPFKRFCSNMTPFVNAVNGAGEELKNIDSNLLGNVDTAVAAASKMASFMSALNGVGEDGETYNIEKNKNAILAWFSAIRDCAG